MIKCCLCPARLYQEEDVYDAPALLRFTDGVLGTNAYSLSQGQCCKYCAHTFSRFYWTIEHVRVRLVKTGHIR